jgi:integrase/recombinase XerD
LKTAEALEAFIASRRAKNCSAQYETWLRYQLARLAAACDELPLEPELLEAVIASARGPGGRRLADRTRRGMWVAMRLLYRWLARRRGLPDVAALLERPVVRPKEPKTLSSDQVDHLLGGPLSRRDRALLLLLLDTGMRIGEAASLTWPNVRTSSVRIRGKTSGGREVPISPATSQALMGLGEGHAVWVGERGPLRARGLQQLVKRALRRAGLEGGPHLLRHTFGYLYIMAGGDVFSLQRIMGHADVKTTWQYVRMNLGDTRVQHGRFSPVARWAAGGG